MNKLANIDVDRISFEQLNKLDAYVKQHFDQLIDKFMDCFEQYCDKVVRMQTEGKKGPVGFIHFSILRTNILAKRHKIRLDAYDEGWYLDRNECSGEYDVQEFYQWLDEFADTVERARNNGFSKIKLVDVQQTVFDESNKYLLFVAELLRVGMKRVVETAGYQEIKRANVFIVCIGGYQDKVDILYKEDCTIKDAKTVKRYLEAAEQTTYTHEICEKLDLSGGNYQDKKVMFSSFTGGDFSDSNWQNSAILFSNFQQTVLKDANLEQVQIFDTDFSGAVLENVSFRGAKLKHISFAKAKLINVSFEDALLTEQLTFDGAKLVNTVLPEMKG